MKFFKNNFLFLLLLILFILIRCWEINEPWIGYHDFNGANFSIMARNYIRFGYLETKFAPVRDVGYEKPDKFTYYLNHPPLLPILLSFSYRAFGIHEWSGRLIPILFSIGNLFLIFILLRRLWDKEVASLGTFFFTLIPMDAYFGRMVCHESPTLFFCLLCMYFYHRWLAEGKERYFISLVISFIIGALIDWPAYYINFLIFLHYLFFVKQKRMNHILCLTLPSIILLGTFIGYTYFLGEYTHLKEAFLHRGSFYDDIGGSFNLLKFLRWEYLDISHNFTPILCLFSLLWLVILFFKIRKVSCSEIFILILLLFGLLHILLFPGGAWVHEYWEYYLGPYIIISSSVGVIFIKNIIPRKVKTFTIFIIISIFIYQAIPQINSLHQRDRSIGYEIGVAVNEITKKDDKIITSFPMWLPGIGAALYFYLDRKVYTDVKESSQFKKMMQEENYDYFLASYGIDDSLLQYLAQNYPRKHYDGFILFKLKNNTPPF